MTPLFRIYRLLFLLFLVTGSLQSFGGVEPYQNQLKGTIKKGDSLIVKDEKFRNAGFNWNEITNRTVKNYITLQLTYDTPVVMNKAFTCELDLKVEYYSQPNQAEPVSINNVKLKINFSPDTGATYKAKDVYSFSNGYWVKITVTNISSPELGNNIPPVLQLTSQVIIDRKYLFHPEKSMQLSGTFSNNTGSAKSGNEMMAMRIADGNNTSNSLYLTWNQIAGAEEYDIEWAVFDENTEKQPVLNQILANQPVAPEVLDVLFRNNATRITTSGHSFDISMVYNAKYIMVRMRQVQYTTDGIRNEDEWDYKEGDGAGTPYAIWSIMEWHEDNLNWQYTATFAEEGKKKEVVSYFDGTMRSRQMVTINNSDQVAVVQETVYDEFGRAGGIILPAPTDEQTFHFYNNFNQPDNGNTAAYDYRHLKGTLTQYCENQPEPLSNASGAAQYYSETNPFANDNHPKFRKYNKYIPHANGYPIAVTQYVNDNTGRIRTQGGVGPVFQPGKTDRRLTKYYYGKPESWELDRLFGNDVGFAHHYQKNMVVDPNGQISINYVNASGKPIATAFTGKAPDNLDGLPSKPAPTTETITLLRPQQFVFDATALSLKAKTTYLASVTGANAAFNYDIQKLIYTYHGTNFQVCSNCYYDLTIQVTNNCGDIKYSTTAPFQIGSETGNCSNTGVHNGTFNVTLDQPGEYYISFELTLSNDIIEKYTQAYIDQRTQNNDLRSEFDFVLDYLNQVDFTGCFNECATCDEALGSQAQFGQAIKDKLTADGVTFSNDDPQLNTRINDVYNQLRTQCLAIKASCMTSSCSRYEKQMLDDVSPGGQFALFTFEPFTVLEPEINVIALHWQNAFEDLAPGTPEYDAEAIVLEDGITTSPFDASFTLEMMVKYWKDDWAVRFLPHHPEKCKLDFCNTYSNYIQWDDKVQQFINKATDIPSIPGYSGNGYSYSNGAWLVSSDPFFAPGAPGNAYIADMEADLNQYSTRFMGVNTAGAAVKGVTQVIDYLIYCADIQNMTNVASGGDSWNNCIPSDNCRVPNREWDQYKEIYFQVKEKYYQLLRNTGLCATACQVGSPYGVPGGCAGVNDFHIEKVIEEVPTCAQANYQKVRVVYAKGKAYRPMTVELYYPAQYASSGIPASVQFAIGESEQAFCIPASVLVPSIKIKGVICTGSAAPTTCNGDAGQLVLPAGSQQLPFYRFVSTNETTFTSTTYTIVQGTKAQVPQDANYCTDGTVTLKQFYNCYKVFMPGSPVPMQFYNVWVIGCTKDLCTNPVQYAMESQIDQYTFYAAGRYYYVKLQSGGGATPTCSASDEYYPCVKMFVGSNPTPVTFVNASVTSCNACSAGQQSITASSSPATHVYQMADSSTYEVFPNTPGNYNPSSAYCSNPVRDWFPCFHVTLNGSTQTFYNATVLYCAPTGSGCTDYTTYIVTGGLGNNRFYYDEEVYKEYVVVPGSSNQPPQPSEYCSNPTDLSYYGNGLCLEFTFTGGNPPIYYENVWLITCEPNVGAMQAQSAQSAKSTPFSGDTKQPAGTRLLKDYRDNVWYLVKLANDIDKAAWKRGKGTDSAMSRPVAEKDFSRYRYSRYFSIATKRNAYVNLKDVWVAEYNPPKKKKSKTTATGEVSILVDFCTAQGAQSFPIEYYQPGCQGGGYNTFRVSTWDNTPLCENQSASIDIYAFYNNSWTSVANYGMTAGQSEIFVCIEDIYGTEPANFKACATVSGTCEPEPPACPDALKYKKSRFPEINIPSGGNVNPQDMQDENNALIAGQIQSNCEAQADKWMQQLGECLNSYSEAMRNDLKAKLIEVCAKGGDLNNPFGASTTRPGEQTASGHSSFRGVIQSVLGLGAFTMTCNPWLLDEPRPYGSHSAVEKTLNNTYISLCSKLIVLLTDHHNENPNISFYQYLVNKYGTAVNITEAQVEMLIKSCYTCTHLLEEDMPMPVFLESGGCVSASEYNAIKSQLSSDFGSNLDPNHDNYLTILTNYLNHRLGFSMSYHRYQAYETELQTNPSAILCNNPPYTEITVDPYTCVKELVATAVINGRRDWDLYIAEEKRTFKNSYVSTCSKTTASAQITTAQQTYHYTLYYYDQAGNLVRTVPPEGVRFLSEEEMTQVDEYRRFNTADCTGEGMDFIKNKVAILNGVSTYLQNTTAKSMELWLHSNSGTTSRQIRFVTPDHKYMYQAAIHNKKLWVELYTLEPGTNGEIAIILTNHAAADITGIALQDWSHLMVQSANFISDPWNLYLDGRKLTVLPDASAPPYPFEWEMEGGYTLPSEELAQLKHLRLYNRPALDPEVYANFSNPCLGPEGLLAIKTNPLLLWGGFNIPSLCSENTETRTVNNRGSLQVIEDQGTGLNRFDNVTNNFTVELWVNPQEPHEIDPLSLNSMTGVTGQKYAIFPYWGGYASAERAGMGISVGTNGVSVYEHADGYMPPLLVWTGVINKWTHIAVVYNNKQPTLYIDGKQVAVGLTSTKTWVSPSYNFGSGSFLHYGFFKGGIDEVRIWNIARTAFDIQCDFNKGVSPATPGLIGYWPMSGEDEADIKDITCAQNSVPLHPGYSWNTDGAQISDLVAVEYAVRGVYPRHQLRTSYAYNSTEQVVQQKSPDGGHSYFWHDRLSRLIASQNEEQRSPHDNINPNRYSYTIYEPILGRITEVGEKSNGQSLPAPGYLEQSFITDFLNSGSNAQITQTVYDKVPDVGSGVQTGLLQENLRKRVSASFYKETAGGPVLQASYNSYDVSGNLKTLWQQVDGLTLKRLDFEYDLVSGKTNFVRYQHGQNDQFYYAYKYDAANKLTEVYTGTDVMNGTSQLVNAQLDAFHQYYLHGSLARTELGQQKVQGLDYAYTLQGWLKGINGDKLNATTEIGQDGNSGSNPIARDVMAYSMGFFQQDFQPIGTGSAFTMQFMPQNNDVSGNNLYNGNVSHITIALDKFRNGDPIGYTYRYDQLNRLKAMRYHPLSAGTTNWSSSSATTDYQESINYDGNGNIVSYVRNGTNGVNMQLPMDNLTYNYKTAIDPVINKEYLINNQLQRIGDVVDNNNYKEEINGIEDLDAQTQTDNYKYDKIGNLVSDFDSKEMSVTWTSFGKVKSIHKNDGTNIEYAYDASGHRIKKVVTKNGVATTTWYVRDAQGNCLSIYNDKKDGITGNWWMEQHLLGSSRLGMWRPGINIASESGSSNWNIIGRKIYELSNHLDNTLVTISDKKIGVPSSGNSSLIDYYAADVISAQDYYPFGMRMPGRSYSQNGSLAYRYGFNGKENDNDVKGGEGNQQDYGMRIYDPRVGRFLSEDPITSEYPELTPYQFASNTPIQSSDLDGLETLFRVGTLNSKNSPLIRSSTIRHIGTSLRNTTVRPISRIIQNWSKLSPRLQHLLEKAHLGRSEHSAWRLIQKGLGYSTEFTVKGGRIDAVKIIEIAGKTIAVLKELKPNNLEAIAKGFAQLERYAQQLSQMPEYQNVTKFIGIVETYSFVGVTLTTNLSITYTIQQNDNLASIAKTFQTTVEELKKLNGLENDKIKAGQKLIVQNTPITITAATNSELSEQEKNDYKTYINSGDYMLEQQMRKDEYKKMQ